MPFTRFYKQLQNAAIERTAASIHAEPGSLAYWRIRILFSILLAGLTLGTFATIAGVILAVEEDVWGLLAFDLLGYVCGIYLFFSRKLSYEARASIALLTCYAVGIWVILSVGPLSGGPAWLFAFAVLAGVLLGAKEALGAILINAGSLALIGWLIQSGRFGADFPFFGSVPAMVAAGVNFIVLNGIVAVLVTSLVKGLVATNEKNVILAKNLMQERAQLLSAKRALEVEVSERQKTQEDLNKSKEAYRLFIDNAPVAIFAVNVNGEFTYANKRLLKLTKYRWGDWVNRSFHPIVHPEDLGIVMDKFQKRLSGQGASDPYEIRIYNASGEIIWVEIVSESIFETEPVGDKKLIGVQSFLTNITRKKEAEQALRESEEKYRHLFELESDAIFLIEKETGNILEVNESAVNLYGFSRRELLRMRNVDLSAEPHQTRKATVEQQHRIPVRYHRKKDGTVFPVEITASHLKWSGREAHIAAIRDITFRIEAATIREELENELFQARKMESIGTLAGGIAHDFNNILHIITGNAELALEEIPLWNPAYENLETIKTTGLKAAGIVRQLLNFSRKSPQEYKAIDIVGVIRETLKFLRTTFPATIEIRTRLPKEPMAVLADPIQINQVMMNICINASQAMEETGGVLEISVELQNIDAVSARSYPKLDPGEYVRIRVSDTGPGIEPGIVDRIFDPYFTTKAVGQGSGMGLAVVHGIVKNHNGFIGVDSQGGTGAAFIILFPLATESISVENSTSDEILGGDERILFVDDEAPIARMTRRMLERLGYTVRPEENPLEAVDLFEQSPNYFDLVITDMAMPQMSGIDLCRRLKEIRADVPIIMSTGHSSRIDENRLKTHGIEALILKPVSFSKIARTVRNVLDKRRSSTTD